MAVFLFGFAKNEADNITADELADLRLLARDLLNAQPDRIAAALVDRALEEAADDEKDVG